MKLIATTLACLALPVAAHVTLETPQARAGEGYKAVLRVSHGCDGTATHTVTVALPEGFRGARPMPKAGWAVTVQHAALAQPYTSHGREVREEVSTVTWTARTPQDALADAHYDEFVVRGQAPQKAGTVWFKVTQLCERGRWEWVEIPAEGSSTRGLRAPAARLDVVAPQAVGAPAVGSHGH